ncbi:MAG: right-handed parallel beta-helix repeat-containing protein [Patescibacteria group bacterium]
MIKFKPYYLFFLALVFFAPLKMQAATSFSGTISSPDWTESNGPYIVTGIMEVTKGAVLTIGPGTEVRFNPGAKIIVNGELDVQGTTENPVIMTSATSTPKSGDWGGIEFTDKAVSATVDSNGNYVKGSIIKNAIIKFSQGIKITDSSPYIANNQITINETGITILGTKATSGGIVLDGTGATSGKAIIPVYIVNNTISDNTTGIKIERNNSQDYIITPAGYSYVGAKFITAYLGGNMISSNNLGVKIVKGDNNVLFNNSIKYNFSSGVEIGSASRSNVLEKNTINNNNVGLDLNSENAFLLQDNIKFNFQTGLKINKKPGVIMFNNIYNNQGYNLDNRVYNLKIDNNYWGASDKETVEIGFWTKGDATTSTSTIITSPIKAEPYSSSENMSSVVMDPFITSDLTGTTTIYTKLALSGLKPLNTAVYVNNVKVVEADNFTQWTYNYDLSLGDNRISIFYRDKDNNKSNAKIININKLDSIANPILNPYTAKTTNATIVLSGTKQSGASVIINDKEIVAVSPEITWTYTYSLVKGINNLTILSKGADESQYSGEIYATIERTEVQVKDILDTEKSLTKSVDAKLAAKLAGRLLLQVENVGNIWYVSPKDNKRYFISQETALATFRSLALGISEANVKLLITKDSGLKLSTIKSVVALRNRLKGYLLLRTENGGQISYLDASGYRYDITNENLMDIFRKLSLGISNANLRKINVGEATK